MTTSFYNGIGGMKTSQVGIDVWGDNIANANTTGFKEKNVDFSTLFSSTLNTNLSSPVTSDVGVSATATTTTMKLSQGNIKQTDNRFDLALEGKGWMAVNDSNAQTFYTRTGSFVRDRDGTLVTQNGDKLQVVNANNLKYDGNNWKFDSTIDTTHLVSDSSKLSEIRLPDNVIFPAQATQKVSIGGNLPNEMIAENVKPAITSSDFGVLYDNNSSNMNLQDGQDIIFGFGKNVNASNGLVRYDMCIADDEIDGNPLNVNFDINGENISLTLPDGSDAKTIVDAISQKLDEKDILYSKTDNSIQLKDDEKLFIKSNGGDIVDSNSAIQKLVYKKDNNQNENFTTIQDFIDKLQNISTFSYGDKATVGLDEKGELFIKNNTDNIDIDASMFSGSNTNENFKLNLGAIGNIVKPNTSSNSLSFNQNYQGFTGNIIDKNGDKNDLKFDFYKTKIEDDNTIWNLVISEIGENGEIISTKKQDLKFDKIGGLLTPTSIDIDNNGVTTKINLGGNFNGITSVDKENSGFAYSQDGFVEGHLVDYDVSDNGSLIANFSNSKSGILGQIPIYHFQNEQGLDNIGSNKFTETNNSGKAFIYKDSTNNYISGANIDNFALETSNVNMGTAMTQLIIIQKAFEANSKSITTSDQMIQKAIDMKR